MRPDGTERRTRILFVHNGLTQFVRIDRDSLRERYHVTEQYFASPKINPAALWNEIQAHDLVFGWFASWHTFLPLLLAKAARRPSLLIIGGYDLANMPEIGYGHQRGGLKKWIRPPAWLPIPVTAAKKRSATRPSRQTGFRSSTMAFPICLARFRLHRADTWP